jgi:endonuclease/exonuclease/phosphatase family metal-dependent hydrolase
VPVVEPRDPWRPLRFVAYALAVAAASLLFIGLVVTDRFAWSQWIWWIPRPALALAALPAAIIGLLRRRGASMGARCFWSGVGLVPVFAMAFIDVGWRRWDPTASGLRIVHWNASWPGSDAGAEPAAILLAKEADVVVVSNAYKLLSDGRIDRWRGCGYEVVNTGSFLVASRWPIIEARNTTGVGNRFVAMIRLEHAAGRLTICAIDLPSDARLARTEVAAALVAETSLPTPDEADLVVGDFNITRGSHSIATMFPGFRHAFDCAGAGFGATWPRALPLLQVDHMLVGARLEPVQYRVFDLTTRVHRAQELVARLQPNRSK